MSGRIPIKMLEDDGHDSYYASENAENLSWEETSDELPVYGEEEPALEETVKEPAKSRSRRSRSRGARG